MWLTAVNRDNDNKRQVVMQADRKEPICKACFSEEVLKLYDGPSTSVYELYQCKQCGVQFWWPQTAIGGHWYEHNASYIIRDQITYDVLGWGQRLFLSRPVKALGLRLLDIGCGSGAFLSQAENLGYHVTGVDYDRKAIERARTYYHLKDVYDSDLVNFCQNNVRERFDVVTMWSVLEHTVSPGEVLRLVMQLIRPGGLLFIEVPNRETIAPDAPPPQHWFRWNEPSLANLLSIHGSAIIEKLEKPLTLYDMITITSAHLRLTHAWYWLFRRSLNAGAENMVVSSSGKQKLVGDKLYKWARIAKNVFFGCVLAIPFIVCRVLRKKGPELYLCGVK